MTPENFASGLRKSIVEDNSRLYAEILENEKAENITDDYWKHVLAFYATLGQDEKQVIKMIMRQVTVDAVSNVLAIVDGVSQYEGQQEKVELVANEQSFRVISGNLQDIFLALEEG